MESDDRDRMRGVFLSPGEVWVGESMGRVRFRFYLTAREIIGSREVEVDGGSPPRLGAALEALRSRLGPKAGAVFDDGGKVREHLTLVMDGRVLRLPQSLDEELPEGSVIDVLPPVGGG